jgi:hypothetical protein
MYQTVNHSPLNAQARVPLQVSPREICGVQNGTQTGFFSKYVGFSLSTSFTQCSMLIAIYMLLIERDQPNRNRKIQCFFGKEGNSLANKISVVLF